MLSRSIRLSVREVSMYLGNLDNDDDDDYNSVATNNKPVITGNWNHLTIIQNICKQHTCKARRKGTKKTAVPRMRTYFGKY